MPWIPLAALFTVVALVLVWAFRFDAARRAACRDAWRSFAGSRGLEWIASSGPWYRRDPDAVEGQVDGVRVRLDTFVVSTGKSHTVYTRVRSPLARPFPGKLALGRRSFLTTVAEKLGVRSIPTGDRSFDERMVLRAKDGDAARQLVGEGVRSRARELDRRATIRVAGDEAKITWRGRETDPSALDAACRLAAALSRSWS